MVLQKFGKNLDDLADDIMKKVKQGNIKLAEIVSIIKSCIQFDGEYYTPINMKSVGSEKIAGERGGVIQESEYILNNLIKAWVRSERNSGMQYSFQQFVIGEYNEEGKLWANIKRGYENSELTYYELEANGINEKMSKTLAYDNVVRSVNGIEVNTKQRNPEKDVIYTESYGDYGDSDDLRKTLERPVLDEKGNVIGRYSRVETQYYGEKYGNKDTVIERKCKGADGKDIVFRTEIHEDAKGDISRNDYLNDETVTTIVMHKKEKTVNLSQYEHGKSKSWTHYEYEEEDDTLTKEKEVIYDEIGNKYYDGEEGTPDFVKKNAKIIHRSKL